MAEYTIDLGVCCVPQNQTIPWVGTREGIKEAVPLATGGGRGASCLPSIETVATDSGHKSSEIMHWVSTWVWDVGSMGLGWCLGRTMNALH